MEAAGSLPRNEDGIRWVADKNHARRTESEYPQPPPQDFSGLSNQHQVMGAEKEDLRVKLY